MCLSLSSSRHLHPILCAEALVRKCSSKSVFFRNFHRKTPGFESLFNKVFLQNTSGDSFYPCYFSCFFFYFSLAALPLLPYSTVTFFVWSNTFVFYVTTTIHDQYHNSRIFIRITANATIYCCTAITMIVKHISALMQFMLKQARKTYK